MSDFDVIVIGSGPGGYVAAIRAAQLGLKTACIEKEALGGTCLNVGCIPSKALLHSSEIYYTMKHHASDLGIEADPSFDFTKMMERKEGIVSSFNSGISMLFKKNKIEHVKGTAKFTSPTTIEVNDKSLNAKHIIIATGSKPASLSFLPIDEQTILSSTGVLSLSEPPKKLVVVGAGIIGVELGSVFSRLGSEVHFVELLDTICAGIDPDLSKELQKQLEKQGMSFHLGIKVTEELLQEFSADKVLVAVGRVPYTEGLNLDAVGILLDEKGRIPVNGSFQTSCNTIYAIGDVIDGPMLAHKASEEGIAVAEILAGKSPKIEYMTIPNVVYTSPEVASVGLSEQEAKEHNLPIKVGKFPFKANSRAKCVSQEEGFVKIIARSEKGTILGVHIIGANAGELIAEGALAVQKRVTLEELANLSHAHPTFSEAIKESALSALGRAVHL